MKERQWALKHKGITNPQYDLECLSADLEESGNTGDWTVRAFPELHLSENGLDPFFFRISRRRQTCNN